MYFVDRMLLAVYSFDSMNAAAISGNLVAAFTYLIGGLAGAAEVYVGQYNGSKQYEKLASPVWQMIYMSLLSAVVVWPIAYFSEYINILPECYEKEGLEYQRILMSFAFLTGLIVALSSFFIGRGRARIVSTVAIFGNMVNAVLTYYLVLKLGMSCRGAAIGTVVAEIVQVVILAIAVFSKKNRQQYGTLQAKKINKPIFCGCIKIGLPLSLGTFSALLAWYVIFAILGHTSKELATIYGLCINLYVLYIFAGEGICKAVTTITANLIGQGDQLSIKKTVRNFVILSLTFSALILAISITTQDWVIGKMCGLHGESQAFVEHCRSTYQMMLANVPIESIYYILMGVLLAGGDTMYATLVQQSTFWALEVFPVFLMYKMGLLTSTVHVFGLLLLWMTLVILILYRRYKSWQWCKKLV
jgi:MATE family multidrug resistance protein